MGGEMAKLIRTGRPGRPTSYGKAVLRKVVEMAQNGATDAEIAQELDISMRTFAGWRARHTDFRHALRFGREAADDRVERALWHRAVGYDYEQVKVRFDSRGRAKFVSVPVHVPPDPQAAMMWLKNRRPAEWKDRVEMTRPDDPLLELINEMKRVHSLEPAEDVLSIERGPMVLESGQEDSSLGSEEAIPEGASPEGASE